jgi:protein tyrosine/serine phosphatase
MQTLLDNHESQPRTTDHGSVPVEAPPEAPGRRVFSRRAGLIWAIVLAAGGLFAAWVYHDSHVPKRFAAVVPDRLYRSGEVTPRQLQYLAERYRIQTVLCLLNPADPRTQVEKAAAEELGLLWVCVPLTGDGASTPEQRRLIKDILLDDSLGPLLVHCAAGANRTGLTIGMYRIHRDGWTPDAVLEEMRKFDFEDLPKHENLREALRAEFQEARAARSATPEPAGIR